MANNVFNFKGFSIDQTNSGMKVGTDGVLLGAWADVSNKESILDIGTGTGLIALMLAQRSKANITAIEPDIKSQIDAQNNFNNSRWSSRIALIGLSLQEFSKTNTQKFDYIISNPPYFSNSLLPENESRKLARHNDSLNLVELLKHVSNLLTSNGIFSIILPSIEEKQLYILSRENGLFPTKKLYIKPNPDKPIKRILVEYSTKESVVRSKTICIEEGGRHIYSREYVELTKDYYLNF